MRRPSHLQWLIPVWLMVIGFMLQAQTSVTLDNKPQSEPQAGMAHGTTTIYVKYGMYDQRKKIFRKSDFFNITRPRYYPRPGNRVRTVKRVKVYSSHIRRKGLRLGTLATGTEIVIERVLRPSHKKGMFGYKGHELWIEAHIASKKIELVAPKDDDDGFEGDTEG